MPVRYVGFALALGFVGCQGLPEDNVSLARRGSSGRPLRVGQHVPDIAEVEAVGPSEGPIERGGPRFGGLVSCDASEVVFKDEEGTGADRLMTPRTREALIHLGRLVGRKWPGVRLRVTEAWDERGEHGSGSLHYEGRAVDLTASDRDPAKLGAIARLAYEAGFDWVYFEDRSHVHASVRR